MNGDGLERLIALQRPDGCFESIVTTPGGNSVDHNGFATASVLRTLRHVAEAPPVATLRRRGLDFLESCASTSVPGAYAFWPDRLRPDWGSAVPADVDDTAIMLAELLRHGRVDRLAALRGLCNVIVPCRVRSTDAAMLPPWVSQGSFHTWVAPGAARTVPVIDCCVNANVVALMAQLDAPHLPGFDDAVRTVVGGLEWAGTDPARLASLTPFYPSLRSLADAVEHAIECGARALREGYARLKALAPAWAVDAGCCSSAYGHAVWRCPALDVARAIVGPSAA